ncbi:MAG TPA: protein kinase, partial [Ktedonobacteraceae bacterium]|nr:protein kinase [Ktedonobacteraceae bacterium]
EDRIVFLGRFQQEANQVASLQHTGILPLVDYGTHGTGGEGQGMSWPYLVWPQLPMGSLSAQLKQKGPMDALLVSRYLDQVSAALEYAHQQASLHRGLTTDCIFIKQDGNLLVADFGVMRMLEIAAGYSKLAARKKVYGMGANSAPAPEQILGQPVDTYTDVYALGAVLYRMLTGHRVFRGKSREELIQQHLKAPVPSLATWRSDLPKELDEVIARAMAKDPARRFRQPGALANAYHNIVTSNDRQRVPFFTGAMPAEASVEKRAGIDAQPALQGPDAVPRTASPTAGGPYVRRAQSGPARISRRRALTLIAAGGGAAAAIAAVAIFGSRYLVGNTSPSNTAVTNNTSAAGTTVPPSSGQGKPILAHTSDVPLNSAKPFPLSGKSNPGLLIHLPDGRFVAFDSTCTHAGCAVAYSTQDKLLECPCHGAIFNPAKNAAVVQGPAQTPLAPIAIKVNADGTITQG